MKLSNPPFRGGGATIAGGIRAYPLLRFDEVPERVDAALVSWTVVDEETERLHRAARWLVGFEAFYGMTRTHS